MCRMQRSAPSTRATAAPGRSRCGRGCADRGPPGGAGAGQRQASALSPSGPSRGRGAGEAASARCRRDGPRTSDLASSSVTATRGRAVERGRAGGGVSDDLSGSHRVRRAPRRQRAVHLVRARPRASGLVRGSTAGLERRAEDAGAGSAAWAERSRGSGCGSSVSSPGRRDGPRAATSRRDTASRSDVVKRCVRPHVIAIQARGDEVGAPTALLFQTISSNRSSRIAAATPVADPCRSRRLLDGSGVPTSVSLRSSSLSSSLTSNGGPR